MKQLLELLKDVRPEADFASSMHFTDDGLLDSFDMVALVATIDKTYGISIDGVDIVPDHFENLDTIAALLRKYGVQL